MVKRQVPRESCGENRGWGGYKEEGLTEEGDTGEDEQEGLCLDNIMRQPS